jgi:hypothetical protein
MNSTITAPLSVPAGSYGAATDAINTILRMGHSLAYFPVVDSVEHLSLQRLRRHSELYNSVIGTTVDWHVMLTLGDGKVLRQLRDRVRGNPNTERWTRSVAERLNQHVESTQSARSLFRPPLWPISGQRTVVRQLSIAPHKDILGSIPVDDRDVFWELANDMELKFWGALDWELVYHDNLQTNPYFPLLELMDSGLYPLGFDQDLFIVFGRAPVLAEHAP